MIDIDQKRGTGDERQVPEDALHGPALQRHRALARTERRCIYCHRILPSQAFRLRPCGLPLSYCRECDLVKRRVRYRTGKHRRQGNRPWVASKKQQARSRLNYAIRKGMLTSQPCEVCGDVAEAHHADYDKPLDVHWLCTVHHGMEHWKPVDTPILAEAIEQIAAAIRARARSEGTNGNE